MTLVCENCNQERTVWVNLPKFPPSRLCNACKNRLQAGVIEAPGAPSGKGLRLYSIWRGMRKRVGRCKGASAYVRGNYVARGISICPEWANSFWAFHDWAMANGYADHLTIDRRDNDKNYEPGNCRWITKGENTLNRRMTKAQRGVEASP